MFGRTKLRWHITALAFTATLFPFLSRRFGPFALEVLWIQYRLSDALSYDMYQAWIANFRCPANKIGA